MTNVGVSKGFLNRRDVYECERDASLTYNRIVTRGPYPTSIGDWNIRLSPFLRAVPGGFENLTQHTVPRDVSALLSCGPKFMIPTFTQMSSGEKIAEFNNLVKNLRNFGFHSAGYEGKESCLRCIPAAM